ncbi:MAG: hypothetical protein CFE21_15485 [Bacteroidetes bacterium B1(2017)]|nr:MAG: hypothetical protein CFE21_15485 [Bacteroidetes bacterium B1(2017)]
MKLRQKISTVFIFIILASTAIKAFPQTDGKISGKVIDKKTGEELLGVTVVVEGSPKGAATDYEGKFLIGNLKPGTYNIVVSYVSYHKKVLTGIEVKANEVTTITVAMEESTKELTEFVVQGELKRETASALLVQQKNATSISDGVSTEVIRKTPDRSTSDVLKRVSGATIQDNKYAIIRGLPDRYNGAFINGSPLPSSEPDRKAFAFDIFPANLLDNLVIVKSATPDLSGEFAGGLILIKTKDIPEQNFYQVSLGSSINTLTTFKDYTRNVKGSTDFLGIDDGTRKLPKGFPDNKTMSEYQNNIQTMDDVKRLVNVAKPFNNNFELNTSNARPAYSLQFSMGHLKKFTKFELGSIFSLSSQSTPTTQLVTRTDYDNNGKVYEYKDKQYTTNTLNGFLWNISYKTKNNKVSLKNLLNINSNDQTVIREGADLINGFESRSYAMWYTQNVLNSHQLSGEHMMGASKTKITWNTGFSQLNRITPDFRRVKYQRNLNDDQAIFQVPLSSTTQPEVAGRFYSNQRDLIYNAGVDVSHPLNIGKFKNELKVGGYAQKRTREFTARQLGYAFAPGQHPDYSSQPLDQIFQQSNIDTNGLVLKEATTPTDAYTAGSNLFATYFRVDSKVTSRFKVIWGVRLESYNQQLSTYRTGINEKFEIDTTVVDFLPSLNLVYSLSEKTNLRASFSQTVSRPEFRELAAFQFFDFNDLMLVEGNANLRRTKIANYDLRYEFYPTPAQLISVSVFYKKFTDPIEKILFSGGSPRLMSYQNVTSAWSAGIEFDYKLNLGQLLHSESAFMSGMNLMGNAAWIKSKVDVSKVLATESKDRPLQGQSPYIVNGGIQYSHPKLRYGVSFMYNRIGQRITNVGNSEYASYWEKGRNVFDLQLNKTLWKNLDIRFAIRDILHQNVIFYQNGDAKTGYNSSIDKDIWNFKVGSSYSLNVSLKF